jgi:hypothetical protein
MKATGAFISVFLCVTPAVAILAITSESAELLALKETDHGPVVKSRWITMVYGCQLI